MFRKTICAVVFAMAALIAQAAAAYAATPQKSDISHRVEVIDEAYILNNDGTLTDPGAGDALVVIDGRFAAFAAVMDGGVSLIPLRAAAKALGATAEWNGNDNNARLEKDGTVIVITPDAATALLDGMEKPMGAPARLIEGAVYAPARFLAENLGCAVSFNPDVIKLPGKYANALERRSIPALSIDPATDAPAITSVQAEALVKTTVTDIIESRYQDTKTSNDRKLFLEEAAYKNTTPSMGRFYYMDASFYDNWVKGFQCRVFVDKYTSQIFMGDSFYGLTEDIQTYLTDRYERHLPLENKVTTVKPFGGLAIGKGPALIYVNFPEQINSNALNETYYIKTSAVEGRVFFSHKNVSGKPLDYIVRFEAAGATSLSLTKDTFIHTYEGNQDAVTKEHMERFYKKKQSGLAKADFSPGTPYDIVVENVSDGQLFSGLIDFTANGGVTVTAFAVEHGEKGARLAATPSILYDYDYQPETYTPIDPKTIYYSTYSGVGASYKVKADAYLTASLMDKQNIAFETGGGAANINHRSGLTEIVDIELPTARGVNGQITKATWFGNVNRSGTKNSEGRRSRDLAANYGNLGNWGVEYTITARIINDTDRDKHFRCEIVPVYQTTWAYIDAGGNVSVRSVNNRAYSTALSRKTYSGYDQIRVGGSVRSSEIDDIVVPAGETFELTYTYVLGTDCESSVFHVWSCVDG